MVQLVSRPPFISTLFSVLGGIVLSVKPESWLRYHLSLFADLSEHEGVIKCSAKWTKELLPYTVAYSMKWRIQHIQLYSSGVGRLAACIGTLWSPFVVNQTMSHCSWGFYSETSHSTQYGRICIRRAPPFSCLRAVTLVMTLCPFGTGCSHFQSTRVPHDLQRSETLETTCKILCVQWRTISWNPTCKM